MRIRKTGAAQCRDWRVWKTRANRLRKALMKIRKIANAHYIETIAIDDWELPTGR